jgi:hypothetical protein
LAVLRGVAGPVRAKEVVGRVKELLPDVSSGSIANIGTRLDKTNVILRDDRGWELLSPEDAGVIFNSHLWAPASVLSSQELAAYRREAILHLLSLNKTGLQATQVEEQLQHCTWLQAPVSKDLVKVDLEVLASDKKIRRRGNTRKWELVPEDAKEEVR